ncbi:hypothetical protein EV356DRAFT_581546 [Viridothelium virens]|uniref:Homeobox domain-containing protein n=1 Tax=Viridothelium virens TaxID=1048519 RepID=A0A6A6GT67_VIRVR|nr:hypothetical protein EV356DRAFT_581546 [Viridothelium virens]
MFYSAKDGAINVSRLERQNPGRRDIDMEEGDEFLKDRAARSEIVKLIDEIAEGIEDSSDEDLEGDSEDVSFESQSNLPESVARVINMSAQDPANPEQLSELAKTTEWFQKRELDMLRCLEDEFDESEVAKFDKAVASSGLENSPPFPARMGDHKSATSATNGIPGIHSERYQAAAAAGRPIDKASFKKMKQSAIRQQVQSESEYVFAKEHSAFTEEERRDGLDQSVVLHEFFESCQIPDAAHLTMFAEILGSDEDTIENWFEGKRRKTAGVFVAQSMTEAPGFRTRQLYRENKFATAKNFGKYAWPSRTEHKE